MHCGSVPGWRVRWGEGGRLKSGLIGSCGLPPRPAPLGRAECGRRRSRCRPSCSRVCSPETRLRTASLALSPRKELPTGGSWGSRSLVGLRVPLASPNPPTLPTFYVTVQKTCLRPEPESHAAATTFVQIDILVNISNFFSDEGRGRREGHA